MASFTRRGSRYITLLFPVLVSSAILLYYSTRYSHNQEAAVPQSQTYSESRSMGPTISEKFGVKIERSPPESKLSQLGITSWPKWGCSPSKFPWTFTATETMYLLEGKVKVYCDGREEFFEIGAGDLVEFPKGMKVVWDVTEAVQKHYNLDE